MNTGIYSLATALFVLAIVSPASAQTPIIFDETYIPTNPDNGFGSFAFGDFDVAGAVTDGADSITLDIVDNDASSGVFGGVGVDYLVDNGSGQSIPRTIDEAQNKKWKVSLKLLPENEAANIRVVMIDDDGGGTADEHVYEFDLTSVPKDGQFHTLTRDLISPSFTLPGAFGFFPGDGVVNPGLRQIQIQSVFGSTGRLNVEVDFVEIVPEPATAFVLAGSAMALRTRRRSK